VKLTGFHVQNFRSVSNSGHIRVDDLTALVGRNESGKSNLLLALASINPPGGIKPLSKIKDFPRDRRLEECKDSTNVLWTYWELSDDEIRELEQLMPGAKIPKQAVIGRWYKNERFVAIEIPVPKLDAKEIKTSLRKLSPLVEISLEGGTDQALADAARTAWTAFDDADAAGNTTDATKWTASVTEAATAFRKALARAGITLPDAAETSLSDLGDQAEEISSFNENIIAIRKKILEWLPVFIYVSEFPELDGHQNISTLVTKKSQGQPLSEAERNFEKLAKVAGFNPSELQKLLNTDGSETRNQLVNRSGALMTKEMRRLWKDRDLKIRFNIDAEHFDTFISDPNSTYDVEVNFNERSRGFRWFFSFYTTFAADTAGGNADGAVLLLDEPGLYLHATSQGDLLKHLREDFPNQILYTTHSPFMVPSDAIHLVRTVNISQEKGTYVTNDPTGDSRTLFPLQAALGYHASQTLFVGPANLVVEGVTDFWLLSSVNEHVKGNGGTGLPDDLVITPAAGAQRVSYMVALLASQKLDVLVLLDDERAGQDAKTELLANKLVRDNNVTLVSEAFPNGTVSEADIEDLLDPSVYEDLVKQTFKSELKGKRLKLNPNIPRIVKRFEEAFKDVSLTFHKTRPARLFMSKMGTEPDQVLTAASQERFEQLFAVIAQRLERHRQAGRKPFQ
jgi:predicted ATP-dependent endonuclease of OLD family